MFTYAHYGPKYLLDQDIVLVTFNYRLGPLGIHQFHLCTLSIFVLIYLFFINNEKKNRFSQYGR